MKYRAVLLDMILFILILLTILVGVGLHKTTILEKNTKLIADQLEIDLIDVEILFID